MQYNAYYLNKEYEDIIELEISDSYFNMGDVIKYHIEIVDYAKKAMESLDIKPLIYPMKGSTDGSKLSFMGLPCPNFSLGHEFPWYIRINSDRTYGKI